MTIHEMILAILRSTRDGEDLDPCDLYLIQEACNDRLNENGEIKLGEIYRACSTGQYVKPWLNGVERMTIDHEGYVYWKGQRIEHYTPSWSRTKDAREQTRELARRCLHLESLGIPVNTHTTIWRWSWFEGLTDEHPYKELLSRSPECWEGDGRLLIRLGDDWFHFANGEVGIEPFLNGKQEYHRMVNQGWKTADAGQGKDLGLCYANLAGMTDLFTRHKVDPEVYKYVPASFGG
jgi:hypothetical protein